MRSSASASAAAELTLREVSERIVRLYPSQPFDHRRFLATLDYPDRAAHLTERYRVEYAAFKFTVAMILRPERIVEIGVRAGISALAFLSACPDAMYTGIDNAHDSAAHGIDFLANARRHFTALDVRADIRIEDSQSLDRFPHADLIHIDGDHSYDAVQHDVIAAWYSGAPWILCDDANDTAVASAIFDALRFDLGRGSVEWTHFPAWTGNILIRTNAGER